MESSAPAEALLLVTANTVPGTNPEDLGQRGSPTPWCIFLRPQLR
ncbi:hypothetical protein [Streptomyces sp. NPDC058476]